MRRPSFWREPTLSEQLQAQIEQAKADLLTARLESVKADATVKWREAHLQALETEYMPYRDKAKSA